MDCPNCQSVIPDTSSFCVYCGALTTPSVPAPPVAATPGSGSSKPWLIVGGAVAAVVVIVVVAFLVMGRGGDSEPSQVVFQPPVDPRPTPAQQPASALPTAPAQQSTSAAPTVPAQRPTSALVAAPVQRPTSPPPAAAPERMEASESGNTIVFSDLGWKSARVQTRIAQYIVEHGYGYSTDLMSGGTPRLFRNLRDGDSHVSMEIWLPLQLYDWLDAQSKGEVELTGSSLDKDWQSTFVIPKYLQEEYPGLDHVDDLKDPRYRELFATASCNGKARLVACVVGWACQKGNDAQFDGYALTGHLQVIRPDSEAALFDDLYRAYAKREPGLGYMWGTADPALVLDLVRLEETPYSDECRFTDRACGFQDSTILIAVHRDLPSRAPEIYDFLTYWNFTTAEYQGVLRWMEDNGATVEQAALNWLKDEGGGWREWVTGEAGVRVQAALDAGRSAEGWPSQ